MIRSDNPGIKEAIQTIKEYGMRKVARAQYEAWLKAKRDQNAMDEYIRVSAREEAIIEGRNEGLEIGWSEGLKIGRTEGEELKLIQLMTKKIQKNKSLDIIAFELEEDMENIRSMYYAIIECAPEYDSIEILEKLHK